MYFAVVCAKVVLRFLQDESDKKRFGATKRQKRDKFVRMDYAERGNCVKKGVHAKNFSWHAAFLFGGGSGVYERVECFSFLSHGICFCIFVHVAVERNQKVERTNDVGMVRC